MYHSLGAVDPEPPPAANIKSAAYQKQNSTPTPNTKRAQAIRLSIQALAYTWTAGSCAKSLPVQGDVSALRKHCPEGQDTISPAVLFPYFGTLPNEVLSSDT
jgi:hypothetical protein